MRQDSDAFREANAKSSKEARFVVDIVFDVASIYLTSHGDIASVPGTVINDVLRDPSALSQHIVPDEGRSEIGSFTFTLVDVAHAFTDAVRTKLQGGAGLRGKQVKYYFGLKQPGVTIAFSDLQLFQTQVIKTVTELDGVYTVNCQDITREQRTDILEPKFTTLRDNITEADTTVPVYDTSKFIALKHGTSYSDAPSSTVYYFKVDKEVIRATGKTADTFTGCTRGALNTRAVAHSVDSATAADRRPKVSEYIYLELPAAKLAYALLTGILYGDSANLPSHWHMGIDSALVRTADFTGIGTDLWDTTSDAAGFIARFIGLTKTDGKAFLESEIYQLIGCYPLVYSDGTLGVRRMNQVLRDSSTVVTLDESNVVSWGELEHDYDSLHNAIRIDWNFDGDEFTRTTVFADADSIAIHGQAPLKTLKFKGLQGSRHTDALIQTRIGAFRDRYTHPPERLPLKVLASLSWLEVGDVVRVKLANVRDFAGNSVSIDRAMEVQQKRQMDSTGEVELELFGSTGALKAAPPSAATSSLPDAYYNSQGTNLTSVLTITVVGGVGIIQAGANNLPGNDDLNNAGAIYYYLGDLQLPSGRTLNITKNVQLRVRGFFQIDGTIDGVGDGHAGVADVHSLGAAPVGVSGFIGNSRGMDGVTWQPVGRHPGALRTRPTRTTFGKYSSWPYLDLVVSGTTLKGLPTDLQGTSGGPGEKVTSVLGPSIQADGGTGAASGAGLCLICRGAAFGAASLVNTSGNSSASTSIVANQFASASYPGPGGAGGPGAFLLLLDGGALSVPDIGTHFQAKTGSVPIDGHPLPGTDNYEVSNPLVIGPYNGYLDPAYISNADWSNAEYRVQYIPETQTANPDAPKKPAPVTNLQAATGIGQNLVYWTAATDDENESNSVTEIWGSITNNLPDAVYIGEIRGTRFIHRLINHETYWYWARNRAQIDNTITYSAWSPLGPTSTATATAERPDDYASAVSAANLFFNGNAEFGDNRNFTGAADPPFATATGPLTWIASGGYNGGPYFSYTGGPGANLYGDAHALVNLDHEHELIGAFRGGSTTDNVTYLGFACLSADGNNIQHGQCWRYPVATYSTTLAANATLGATSIDVNLPANHWDTIGGALAIHFNVDNDDDGSDLPTPVAKYVYVNTVTKSNLGGGVWRYTFAQGTVPGNFTTGQRVNVSVDGATFVYALVLAENPTTSWQRRVARVRGINAPTAAPSSFIENGLIYFQFRRGTVYVKPILLHAYGAAAARTTHYDELQLYDIGPKGTAIPPDADNTYKQRLIPDAEFDNIDPTNYWQIVDLAGGGTSTIGFSSTGGIFGGRALLHFGTQTTELRPLTRTNFQPIGDPNVGVYLRMRRTASLAATLFMEVCAQRFDGVGGWGNNSGYSLSLNNTTLPVANTWYEFYVPRKFFAAGAAANPFQTVTLRIIGSGSASGDIEIDAFQATVLGNDFTVPTASVAGFQGTVPAPPANATPGSKVLADDATFKDPVTAFAIMKQGLATIPVLAAAMQAATTNGAALAFLETATNKVLYKTLDFDQTTQEFAGFAIPMPKSWNRGTITFQPIWTFAAGTGGVVWALQAVACSDADASDVAYGTEQTSSDTALTAGQVHVGPASAAITVAGTPAVDDLIFFRVKRNPAAGGDTLTGDARLIAIRIFYSQNAGDDT